MTSRIKNKELFRNQTEKAEKLTKGKTQASVRLFTETFNARRNRVPTTFLDKGSLTQNIISAHVIIQI